MNVKVDLESRERTLGMEVEINRTGGETHSALRGESGDKG